MPDTDPAYWSIAALHDAYRAGSLSPLELVDSLLERIDHLDPTLHAYVSLTPDLAKRQAAEAARLLRAGGEELPPLLGIPVSVKDVFHVAGSVTTLGSLAHRGHLSLHDSGLVRRLRAAGAVFPGKTNTAEFGQSATTDNRLGPDAANPWDPTRTPGGSSGGAAVSVAAGMATAAVGSDGGGSIRIPAAFTGLVGLKPTPGRCPDEHGFRAMTEFVSPGPLARTVADARALFAALTAERCPSGSPKGLRTAWCPNPEGRPVHREVLAVCSAVARNLGALGHVVEERELPLEGWDEVFGVLVLADEHRERGHLLMVAAELLTEYERRSLEAARELSPHDVADAERGLIIYRRRIHGLFDAYDLLVTPTTAVPAFPLRERPAQINGTDVSGLWGAFPFCVPFNVAGVPAISIPVGLVDGMPVGLQLVARPGAEALLLDVAEQLEATIGFDPVPPQAAMVTARPSA